MIHRLFTLLISLIIFVFIGCSSSGKRNPEYLPAATGKPGDILVVMDSNQWKDSLGIALRKILKAEIEGLPREEPMFNVIWVQPTRNLSLLAQLRNIMFVFTLDRNTTGTRILKEDFSAETLERIKSDTSFFSTIVEDEYARGQKVMYLYGDTEQALIHHLRENGKKITDFINTEERKRIQKQLLSGGATKGLTSMLREDYHFEMRFPVGYKIADKQRDFIWLRAIEPEVDKDIWVTWKSYESEYQLLPDSLIAWRDATAKKYLFGDPADPVSYVVTELEVSFIPVVAKQVNFNDQFAMELRGLWRTNTKTMGGPFLSYGLVDESRNLVYYIEGFTFSPGKDQREIMRQLEAILWSFKPADKTNPG